MIKGMKVRCIDNSDRGILGYDDWPIFNPNTFLVVGKEYTVVGQNGDSDFILDGMNVSWCKDRFVPVCNDGDVVKPKKTKRYKVSRAVLRGRLRDVIGRLDLVQPGKQDCEYASHMLDDISFDLSDILTDLLSEKK